MSLRTDHPPRPNGSVSDHYRHLDVACRAHHLRGVRVWRLIRTVSQLSVILYGIWTGYTGRVPPEIALATVAAVYLGVEYIETKLADDGRKRLSDLASGTDYEVTVEPADGDRDPATCENER